MEDRLIAVYVMVREDELQAEDGGSYDAPLARQKAACLEFVRQKLGDAAVENTDCTHAARTFFWILSGIVSPA